MRCAYTPDIAISKGGPSSFPSKGLLLALFCFLQTFPTAALQSHTSRGNVQQTVEWGKKKKKKYDEQNDSDKCHKQDLPIFSDTSALARWLRWTITRSGPLVSQRRLHGICSGLCARNSCCTVTRHRFRGLDGGCGSGSGDGNRLVIFRGRVLRLRLFVGCWYWSLRLIGFSVGLWGHWCCCCWWWRRSPRGGIIGFVSGNIIMWLAKRATSGGK